MSIKPPARTSCDHSIYFRHRYEWVLLAVAIAVFTVLLAGCATPAPVPKLIYAHDSTKALKAYENGVKRVLATPCPATRARATIATVNDLLDGYNKGNAAAECRQSNIDQALKVKAPAPAT